MQRPPVPPLSAGVPTPNVVNNSANVAGGGGNPTLGPPRPSSDPNIDNIVTAINEIRGRILELLHHIENQPDSLSWTTVMDKFSVISSGMSNLAKSMKAERFPDFRKLAVVPYHVSPDIDPAVEKITEGRVSAVNHDNVPNYLRTKLDPEVEDRFNQAINKVPLNQPDLIQKADKQIQNSNKIVGSLLELLPSKESDWDTKTAAKGSSQKFYNESDTLMMLQAMTTGKGVAVGSYRTGPPR